MIRISSWHRSRLASATALGFLAIATVAAKAQTAPAFDLAAPAVGAAPAASKSAMPGLAPLLTSPTTLRFSGEAARRTYPVFVTAEQSTQAAKLSLGYTTAVSVAPEGSSLQVLVNGTELVSQPLKVGSAQSIDVLVPPGLLRAGFNAVNVSVQQFHRVDCSIQGTYELWTTLDPAASGLTFGRTGTEVASLSDLPALARNADGKVPIAALVPDGSSTDRLNATLVAIEAAVVIGSIQDPIVQVKNTQAAPASLQVAVGTADELGALVNLPATPTPWPGVSFIPAQAGQPATLIVSGSTAADVSRSLGALKAGATTWTLDGSQSGLQAVADRNGRALPAGGSVDLAALGADDRAFAGRLFQEELAISLPADFYAADYDAATLVLDGAYAAGLSSEALLFVRANGQVVATLSLSSPKRGQIQDKRLKIPLDTLKPGANTISIQAVVPNASDSACEVTASGERPTRFKLSPKTRIEMPALARVGAYPNLSATLAGVGSAAATEADRELMIYVPGGDGAARDVAATLVARMAAGSGTIRQPRFVSALPHAESGDLLAVGTYSALPNDLMAALQLSNGPSAFGAEEETASWKGISQAQAATGSGEVGAESPKDETALSAFAEPVAIEHRIAEITRPVTSVIRNAMAQYGADERRSIRDMPEDGSLLVQAAAPASGSAWTVFTAPTTTMLTDGMHRLGTPETWESVAGARTEIPSAADQAVVTVGQNGERLFETQPRSLSNARLVLAGWFSRHSERYAAFVVASSLLLAVSTYLLLRRVGVKGR